MNKQKSKAGKVWKIIGIVAGSLILIYGLLIAVPFFAFKAEKHTEESHKNYASDYHLRIDDGKNVMKRWWIEKNKDDGIESLEIRNPGKKTEEIDYLTVYVYDSDKDAKAVYDNLYEEYIKYDYGWREYDNYFVSGIPGVCDAEIFTMFYLEGNVIITADIEIISCWAEPFDPENPETTTVETIDTTDPAGDAYDRSLLEDYICKHASDVRDYMLNTVLEAE